MLSQNSVSKTTFLILSSCSKLADNFQLFLSRCTKDSAMKAIFAPDRFNTVAKQCQVEKELDGQYLILLQSLLTIYWFAVSFRVI